MTPTALNEALQGGVRQGVGGQSSDNSSYGSSQGSVPRAFRSSLQLWSLAQSVTWHWLPLRVRAPNLSWAAGKGPA